MLLRNRGEHQNAEERARCGLCAGVDLLSLIFSEGANVRWHIEVQKLVQNAARALVLARIHVSKGEGVEREIVAGIELVGSLQRFVALFMPLGLAVEHAQVPEYGRICGIELLRPGEVLLRLRIVAFTERGTADGLEGLGVFRLQTKTVAKRFPRLLVLPGFGEGNANIREGPRVVRFLNQHIGQGLDCLTKLALTDCILSITKQLFHTTRRILNYTDTRQAPSPRLRARDTVILRHPVVYADFFNKLRNRLRDTRLTPAAARAYNGTSMIAIIIVGDEILSGDVHDENLPYMIDTLTQAGYRTTEARVIGDDVNVIAETFRELAARHDYVLSAGGIGPTHDDVTLEGAAKGLGLSLERHPVMQDFLAGHYGEPMPESVSRMALLPEGAEVFIDYAHHWPLIKCQNCFILPGLPVALRDKVGRIAAMLPQTERQWAARLFLNADETDLALWLSELQRRHPGTAIGSYPLFRASYSTRITVKSADKAECEATFEEARAYFRDKGWLLHTEGPELVGSGD